MNERSRTESELEKEVKKRAVRVKKSNRKTWQSDRGSIVG